MKNKTIPFLFSLFLLASCGETKPCETHTYGDFTVTKEASCGVAGSKERTCTVCGEKDVVAIDALTHNYVDAADQTGAVAATCAAKGKVITECSNCHDKSFREVDKLTTHTFVDATDQTGAKPATCKEAGTVITQCSVCGEKSTRVAEKLTTHTYGEYTQTKAPTHAVEGSKEATCSVCGAKDTQPIAKLTAHEFGETPTHVDADHDVIAMDVYNCATDNVKKIVWDANDVTLETKEKFINSKPNYTTQNGGVKLGDYSIGNSSPAGSGSYKADYDSTIEGSFIEYKINIKESILGATLFSDMQPASGLNSQGGLFMAAPQGSDWTPGLVSDGTETGFKISDFRVLVFVNGKAVNMDPTKNVAANAARNRGEYNFPCTVDLKAGINTIKIVKAGGWEATYYKFGIISSGAVNNVVPDASEGYTVEVTGDEHVTDIKFFEDERFTLPDIADVHYSRTEQGRKSKEGDGQCNMAITVEEGYKVKEIKQISPATKAYKNFKFPVETSVDSGREDSYKITKIEDDIVVQIITEPDDVVYEGFSVELVKGEHVVSIELYSKDSFADNEKIDGLVAVTVDKNSKLPTKTDGQIYAKIIFEEGYVLDDASTKSNPGTTATPNKVEAVKENCYKFTKVNSDGIITVMAKAIA